MKHNILQKSFSLLVISGLVCLVFSVAQMTAQAMTFTVNSPGDQPDNDLNDNLCSTLGGDCTLRAAIQQANATVGPDIINFNLPPGALIAPNSDLPIITSPMTIDAGSSASVEISGYHFGSHGVKGIHIQGTTDVTIHGLVINDFIGIGIAGILIDDSSNVNVTGSYIGTNPTGTSSIPNSDGIVLVNGVTNCLIGGTTTAEANLISGNLNAGIYFADAGSSQIRITGNYIGVNAAGTAAFSGQDVGVALSGSQNQVGGPLVSQGNLISGNGVGVSCNRANNTLIQGNYIGTNATGSSTVANLGGGIFLGNSTLTTIQSNVIAGNSSGNLGFGIKLDLSSSNEIYGNFIGVGADGITPLSSKIDGIIIQNNSDNNVIGSASSPNVIANTLFGQGIIIVGDFSAEISTGNQIRFNSIYSNGLLGLDLHSTNDPTFPPWFTLNDSCDGDTGPNQLQNFPVISSAVVSASDITISGSLDSTPNTTFTIDFYSNESCDSSGYGEGQTYLGSTTVTTGSLCNFAFNITFPLSVPLGQAITATATDPTGNTSEFSLCRITTTTAPPSPPTLTNVAVTTPVNENGPATLSGNINDADAGDTFSLTVDWGDGSTPQIFNYPAGTTSFNETHQYLDDNPSVTASDNYTINLTLSDNGGGGSDNQSTSVTVNNLAPTLSNIQVMPSTITVGDSTTLDGNVNDVGTIDSHTVVINWGDGSANTTLNLAAGVSPFSAGHSYATSGVFTIGITANDDDSGTVNAVTSVTVNPLPTPPNAPTDLIVTSVATTQIDLSWSDNANNEFGFKIERCTGGKRCTNFIEIAQVAANVVTFSNAGLTRNTNYHYRVRAFNSVGDSGYSNTVTAKTLRR